MQKLDPAKPLGAEDLFESVRETRAKINELIDALGSADKEAVGQILEKVASVDGEVGNLKNRMDVADKALSKTIAQLALHTHAEHTGASVIPLAV